MTEYTNRFSRHAVGGEDAFFDSSTQSFLRTEGWGHVYLSGLADGLDIHELAREIALHCGEPVNRITGDINRFLAELDVVETSEPLVLDNSEIFSKARRQASVRCRCAGVRRCNGATVTVGFDSEMLRNAFQHLTFDSLELTGDRVCDVFVSGNQRKVRVQAIGEVASDIHPLNEGVLAAYCTSDSLLSKRIDSLFIAHAGAVTRAGVSALLPALGFSGKSTLVASLGLSGYDIIHDDLVPVLNDGTLVSLGHTVKLREGSWPEIKPLYPNISCLPVIASEHDSPVKLIQPPARRSNDSPRSFDCQFVIIPKFDPNSKPLLEQIPPLEALYKLVESGSLLKKPAEREALHRVCSWVGTKRCYNLTYPDTYTGLALVEEVFSNATATGTMRAINCQSQRCPVGSSFTDQRHAIDTS